jgi:hypothetical protein
MLLTTATNRWWVVINNTVRSAILFIQNEAVYHANKKGEEVHRKISAAVLTEHYQMADGLDVQVNHSTPCNTAPVCLHDMDRNNLTYKTELEVNWVFLRLLY